MYRQAYIAITSAIIVALVLIIVVVTLSLSSFFSSRNILDTQIKESGQALAESCGEVALLKLAQNSNYGGNETITIGNNQCTILPIETLSGQKIIKTTSFLNQIKTNIRITAGSSDLSIISWEEIGNF